MKYDRWLIKTYGSFFTDEDISCFKRACFRTNEMIGRIELVLRKWDRRTGSLWAEHSNIMDLATMVLMRDCLMLCDIYQDYLLLRNETLDRYRFVDKAYVGRLNHTIRTKEQLRTRMILLCKNFKELKLEISKTPCDLRHAQHTMMKMVVLWTAVLNITCQGMYILSEQKDLPIKSKFLLRTRVQKRLTTRRDKSN